MGVGMDDTIWTMRGVNEHTSTTKGWLSQGGGDQLEIYDPSLSPDWLRMPCEDHIPPELRGKKCKIFISTWFGLTLCPEAFATGRIDWQEKKTRWHLLEEKAGGMRFVVVEAHEIGWCVISMEQEHYDLLVEHYRTSNE